MLKNTESSYGVLARVLHIIGAFLFIGMLFAGFYMTGMPNSDEKWAIYGLHKSFGFIALFYVLIRFFWRMKNIIPILPQSLPNWQKLAAKANVQFLYLFMFAMPISGILMSLYGGYDISIFNILSIKAFNKNDLISTAGWYFHTTAPYAFALLITIHFCAALYHHFILKDNILRRMFW